MTFHKRYGRVVGCCTSSACSISAGSSRVILSDWSKPRKILADAAARRGSSSVRTFRGVEGGESAQLHCPPALLLSPFRFLPGRKPPRVCPRTPHAAAAGGPESRPPPAP